MKKPDEIEIIKIFQSRFGQGPKFIPEDLEVLSISNQNFLVKSDMLVQSTDVPAGMKLYQVARKSLVSCVSDFACKGIKPRYAIISLAIPRGFTRKMINELAIGFAKASKEFAVKIIGGDVNQGKEIVIDVSMFGVGDRLVRRGGAKKGDIIVTSGPFGYSSSGLKIILRKLKADPKFVKKCKKSVFLPTPRLEFGLKAARYFSSSMDSSDGLSITLNDMSKLSKKRFFVTRIPTEKDVEEFAKKKNISLVDLVFCGGEEYEMVATVPKKNLHMVRNIAKKLNVPLFEIGYVTNGKNVILVDKKQEKTLKRCGWVHLRS
ncbi:MAG: thiamine-phosphate kinase [Thaumarchaeota archaeon]|nr:thiamine-phosphate kinase [Nitrososphaerota archaeon]